MIKRLVCFLLLLVIMFPAGSSAAPMSAEDQKDLWWPYYDNGEVSGSGACASGGGSGALPSGVPQPYNKIISEAADKFGAHAGLVAAVFYWENRGFPPADKTEWAVSPAGATGPMQFLPTTFEAYKEDGDGDGDKDINNLYDALYSGARYLAENGGKTNVPLGSLDKPLNPGTLLRVAASYNWGPANVQGAGVDATLDNLPSETSEYLKAVYVLISSDFSTKPAAGGGAGVPGTGDDAPSANPSACADLGTGKGSFTDNTEISIPGASQAVAKAREIAKYSPSQLQAICDGDPNCLGMCERLAAVAWGRTSSGYASANVHWFSVEGSSRSHPGDRNVPVGALLYYDTGSESGHVATYLGNNLILSNDVGDAASGITGGAYIVDAQDMEGGAWNLKYRGWVNPVPWL